MKKIMAAYMLLVTGFLVLSGCSNTIEGIGKDTERAGREIQEEAH
ncbi:MAG: entericidin A/B family lipoprotein [Candidatus Omnitrophota bacterium]|nr:entericidin A/B family lipoprotein [Candidatus Omnitrophota bacterium]